MSLKRTSTTSSFAGEHQPEAQPIEIDLENNPLEITGVATVPPTVSQMAPTDGGG